MTVKYKKIELPAVLLGVALMLKSRLSESGPMGFHGVQAGNFLLKDITTAGCIKNF